MENKVYCEFRLHAGRVPFFVSRIFSNCNISGKYYGISRDTEQSYLPSTVVTFEEEAFKAILIANADLYKYVDGERVEMTKEEKTSYVNQWISKHPVS